MNQYPIVAVEWIDGAASHFTSTYDLDEVKDFTLVKCRTVGHLIHETDDRIVLVAEAQEQKDETTFRFLHAIPKSGITRIIRYFEEGSTAYNPAAFKNGTSVLTVPVGGPSSA